MFSAYNQFATTTQFYLYGKNKFTQTGWEKASKNYPHPDILSDESSLDLSSKVYMVTGANSGIGKEVTKFLAKKGATIYMICRNAEKACEAKAEIFKESNNHNLHILLGSLASERDVHQIWSEFCNHRKSNSSLLSNLQLDGLLCAAGALLDKKTFTEEEVEITFATHLLFGTYLLGSLAMDVLNKTPNSRFIAVSSGGMYNTKLPKWSTLSSTGNSKYDGQMAYAYAKRGQVILCEEWAKMYPNVKTVSCHPGWTATPGVEKAYGESKKYLEPLRTVWQGAEGIVWLLVAPSEEIETGAFYLDRSPQVKHLSGPFFSEGSYTKNSPEEVADMMRHLEQWANVNTRPSLDSCLKAAAKQVKLKASDKAISIEKFASGDWYVLANIPTPIEKGASNCIEKYSLRPTTQKEDKTIIDVKFEYYPKGTITKTEPPYPAPATTELKGTVLNPPVNTHWGMDPKLLGIPFPVGLDYLLLDYGDIEGFEYSVVSVPDRSYFWVMLRVKPTPYDKVGVSAVKYYSIEESSLEEDSRGLTEESKDFEKLGVGEIDEAEKLKLERKVLIKSLGLAKDLGFDINKVERVPWHVVLDSLKR